MRSEIILTFRDEDGAWREVEVAQKRFTIGSGIDNNLVIRTPDVSRRHAVIENHDGVVLAYDCQSQRGTLLNNVPLRGSAPLHSGDLLTLGGACDITVKLRASFAPPAGVAQPSPAPPPFALPDSNAPPRYAPLPHHVETQRPRPRSAQPSIIIAAVAVLLILITGFILLARRQPTMVAGDDAGHVQGVAPALETVSRAPVESRARTATGVDADADALGDEELERAAVRAVQRASGQSRPYAFPPEALRDIGQQIEKYRQSNRLRDAFVSMQRGARSVAAQARDMGVEPDLVVYAALAHSDDGRDASATARAMIPQLAQLRQTFGGGDPDGSLLIIAAYTDGVGSKKAHPLLATIRRLVRRNPFAERNVWFLRERGGLSDAAYDFVIRTIAVGVIAQDPHRHGLQATPLVY